MASISKYTTKKGTFYRATIYAGIDPETGKQENITKRGFKTKKEANAWADKTRFALAQGVKLESKKHTKMTFNELYQEWFEQYRYTVKPSTAHKTEELFRLHILPAFGSMNLQAIKTPMVQRQVNTWFHEYSKYKTMYNYTHRVLAYAVRRNYIKTNVADNIILPRRQKKVEADNAFWTKKELNTFLAACKEDERKDIYPFFRLLAYTGMRRGEILALEWKDFKDGYITIRQAITTNERGGPTIGTPKSDSSARTIPLDPETIHVLEEWQHYATGPFIFYGEKPMCEAKPRKWMQQICARIELKPIKIHGLRHTHCSLLFEAGATPKEVQERLGHSSAEITLDIYTHLSSTKREQTPKQFADYMDS